VRFALLLDCESGQLAAIHNSVYECVHFLIVFVRSKANVQMTAGHVLLFGRSYIVSIVFGASKRPIAMLCHFCVWHAVAPCLFVCLLLNGTSAVFRPLVPRIIEHTSHVKNDLK